MTHFVQKLQQSLITLKFHTRSISYWHCNRIYSKYSPLTCTRAHRCVCHSLIAGRVLYLSAEQRSHIQSPRSCLVSRAGNSTVRITRSNSQPSGLHRDITQ